MIRGFRHKGLENFFKTGSKAGIQAKHANKLKIQLTALEHATCPMDMNATRWHLHALSGNLAGFYAIFVNGNWRLVFRFQGKDVVEVDYLDYH